MTPRRLPSGRWQGIVRVGGRRHTHVCELRRDAVDWEAEQRIRLRQGTWVDPRLGQQTFDVWVARWMAARNVEPETAVADARTLARHVLPHWSGWPIAAVGRLEVQAWVTQLSHGTGAPTVFKAYNLLAGAMAAAAEEDLIGRTPCRGIRLPEPNDRRLDWWTVGQLHAILAVLDEPYRTVAALMAWCGLRWEEAAALSVASTSWLRREVTVHQVVTSARRVKPYAKSSAGNRVVRMEGPVAELLEPHWQAAAPVRELIWVARDGRPLLSRTWGAYWRAHVRDGLDGQPRPAVPYYSAHVLRHSGASWLAQAGVPLGDLGRWLGHGHERSTRIYSHLCPERSNATIGEAMASLTGHPTPAHNVGRG
jgi:integrase